MVTLGSRHVRIHNCSQRTLCGVTYVWCGEICRARVYMDGGGWTCPVQVRGDAGTPCWGYRNQLLLVYAESSISHEVLIFSALTYKVLPCPCISRAMESGKLVIVSTARFLSSCP